MKITIEPTPNLVSQTDLDREHIPRMVRVWEGITDQGTKCKILVCGVMVAPDADQAQFQRELAEIPTGNRVIDLRHIL